MQKKATNYLLEDDSFFLNLHLMGYPHSRKNILFFSDLACIKYKCTQKSDILVCLATLRDNSLLKFENPAPINSFLWELAINNSAKQIERFFKRRSPSKINELFEGNDFEIIIQKETQELLSKRKDEYINDFMDDAILNWPKNYLLFEDQKELLIKKITSDIKKYGRHEQTYHDSEMPEGCKFFDIMFALQKMNYLKIKHITGASENAQDFFYKIIFIADKKKFPISKPEKPICEITKGFGFLKFGEKEKRIRISKADSKPFKLLSFLIKPFGIARSVDEVFAIIQTERSKGLALNSGAYLEMGGKIKAIENTKKELQKIKEFTRIIKIKIDKKSKIVWLEYKK